MKKFAVLFFLAAVSLYITANCQQAVSANTYTVFLENQHTSAKDYILNLFKDHDIVIICERTHTEMTQYNLITDIVADKRFIDNVGNIFTETGVSTLNPALNTFLHTRHLPADTVTQRIIRFQRNCSFWPVWSNENYAFFLHKLYDINNQLPAGKAINVYPSDLPFTWTGADSAAMLQFKTMLAARDSIMAAQVIATFNNIKSSAQPRKKALVIMNYRHAFNQAFQIGEHTLKNMAWFLFNKYGGRVANVLLNTVGFSGTGNFMLLQGGKWDAAFSNLGKENAGFSFTNTPFGKDSFDLWPYKTAFTYENIFTGFAFYLPIEKHYLSEGYPGLVDSAYRRELMRRIDLICIVGGEFLKMRNLKTALQADSSFLNIKDDKKYYQLDSLISVRNHLKLLER
ncbi:MAG TPA: hypothetical protein VG738_05410 [Chitinophagaceae bacterium]|nr:hypothetical protein [Chitinophagaceae bacterium]